MRVEDIERVIYGGQIKPRTLMEKGQRRNIYPIDVKVPGDPRVELTVWVADEGTFASITGTVPYLRQVVIGGSGDPAQDAQAAETLSLLGIDEANNTIRDPRAVINSTAYADAMGLIFKPDTGVTILQEGSEVALPYYLIGRARRIFPEDDRPWRVSSRPTPQANRPFDSKFLDFLKVLREGVENEEADAAAQRIAEPTLPYSRSITPYTSIEPAGRVDTIGGMRLKTSDPLEGKEGLADQLSIMNLYRTAGADFRSAMGKPTSVIEKPHDPLKLTQDRKRRRKKRQKETPVFNNPNIAGRQYIMITQSELERIARQEGMSVEQVRRKYPNFITRKEAAVLREGERGASSRRAAGSPFVRSAMGYRRKANPAEAEVGDHYATSDGDFNCVIRRVMDDGSMIIQAFIPAPDGGRATKYFPFKKVEDGDIGHLQLVERGFAERMRDLKARGE
jgi:hypothetical protein